MSKRACAAFSPEDLYLYLGFCIHATVGLEVIERDYDFDLCTDGRCYDLHGLRSIWSNDNGISATRLAWEKAGCGLAIQKHLIIIFCSMVKCNIQD